MGHAEERSLALPRVSIVEVARRFTGTTQGRYHVRGLLAYRETLGLLGLTSGFQWLMGPPSPDGGRAARRPAQATDVDVVTFCHRPPHAASDAAWRQFVDFNEPLLDPTRTWAGFGCRSYLVDLDQTPAAVVTHARFWSDVLARQCLERGSELMEAALTMADDEVAARLVPWS